MLMTTTMMMMVAMAMAMTMAMMMMVVAVMVMMMIAWRLPEELAMESKQSTRMFAGAVVWPDTFSVTIIIIL